MALEHSVGPGLMYNYVNHNCKGEVRLEMLPEQWNLPTIVSQYSNAQKAVNISQEMVKISRKLWKYQRKVQSHNIEIQARFLKRLKSWLTTSESQQHHSVINTRLLILPCIISICSNRIVIHASCCGHIGYGIGLHDLVNKAGVRWEQCFVLYMSQRTWV